MVAVIPAVIVPSGFGTLAVLAATALTVVTACLPLRGGHGQHAGAGPGALTVRHLSSTVPVTRPQPDSVTWPDDVTRPEQEKITWPEQDPDELTSWLRSDRGRTTTRMVERGCLAEAHPRAATGALPHYVGRHRLRSITDTHHVDVRFHPLCPQSLNG